MKPNMPLVWLLLTVDVAVSSCGNVLSKRGAVLAAMVAYSLANMTWIAMLRAGAGQLARMGILCDIANCFSVAILGVVFYREALTTRHAVGLVVALVGIILLGGGE